RYAIDLSPNRPWDGPFSFHDPGQREEWRERIAWNAQLLDQLIEEAARADVPVAVLYIPAYPVFLRAREPNPAAAAVREVADRRDALWLDATDWFATAPAPAELYYAFGSHPDPAAPAATTAALARDQAPPSR